MDNSCCRSFFLEPIQTFHRQYEALRAFFVEGRPLREIARQWGYGYSSLRSMVCRFRAQVQAGQLPPFFLNLSQDARPAHHARPKRSARKERRPRTVGS